MGVWGNVDAHIYGRWRWNSSIAPQILSRLFFFDIVFLRQGVVSLQTYLVIVYAFLNLIQMVVPGSVSMRLKFMIHDRIAVLTVLHFTVPYQQLLVHTLFPLSSHQDSLSVEMHPLVYPNLINYYSGCSLKCACKSFIMYQTTFVSLYI